MSFPAALHRGDLRRLLWMRKMHGSNSVWPPKLSAVGLEKPLSILQVDFRADMERLNLMSGKYRTYGGTEHMAILQE